MQCPYCQYTNNRVLESRPTEGGQSIRRRRECLQCQHRFTTYERIEFVPIIVVKKDGKKESFDRSELLKTVVRACENTGMSSDRPETIVDEIESVIQQRLEREISTIEITKLVLDYLRLENEIAYVRFASVYGKFQNIDDFIKILKGKEVETHLPKWNNLIGTIESQKDTLCVGS